MPTRGAGFTRSVARANLAVGKVAELAVPASVSRLSQKCSRFAVSENVSTDLGRKCGGIYRFSLIGGFPLSSPADAISHYLQCSPVFLPITEKGRC